MTARGTAHHGRRQQGLVLRARLVGLLCGLLCGLFPGPAAWAGGVLIETDGVDSFARRLFLAIDEEAKDIEIASLVHAVIAQEGRDCMRVSDYQIYARDPDRALLKVKCPGTPIYGLQVRPDGRLTLFGGDGIVRGLRSEDGPIVSIYGASSDGLARAAGLAVTTTPAAGPRSEGGRLLPIGLWLLLGLNLAVLGCLALFVYAGWRRTRLANLANPTMMTKKSKDVMLAESVEVLPMVYKHHTGLYIVRGRHGKRRLFPSLLPALLYRRLGWRVMELR